MKAAKKALALLLSVLMLYGFGAGVSAEEPEDAETQAYALREVDDEIEDWDEEIPEDVPPEPTKPTTLKERLAYVGLAFLWPAIIIFTYILSIFNSGNMGSMIGFGVFLLTSPITLPVSLVIGLVSMPFILILGPSALSWLFNLLPF